MKSLYVTVVHVYQVNGNVITKTTVKMAKTSLAVVSFTMV